MVTREAGRVSGIRGRVVLAAAGIAFGLATAVTGFTQAAVPAESGSHLRLGDVGWNNANPHVVAGDELPGGAVQGDVGWNNPTPAAPATPAPGSTNDVGWN